MPLSSQSLFDNKFWCPYVIVIGDLGLDLIPHQVNPVADKDVQLQECCRKDFLQQTYQAYSLKLKYIQSRGQLPGKEKSHYSFTSVVLKIVCSQVAFHNSMFLGCFSYNVTTVEQHFRNVTWAVICKVAAKAKVYFIDLQNPWWPSQDKL